MSPSPAVGLNGKEPDPAQKLNGIPGLNALYLRAGYFMENLLPQTAVIQNFGIVGGPWRLDLRLPLIATRDIGVVAAGLLLKPDLTGKEAREQLGQKGRELSGNCIRDWQSHRQAAACRCAMTRLATKAGPGPDGRVFEYG